MFCFLEHLKILVIFSKTLNSALSSASNFAAKLYLLIVKPLLGTYNGNIVVSVHNYVEGIFVEYVHVYAST